MTQAVNTVRANGHSISAVYKDSGLVYKERPSVIQACTDLQIKETNFRRWLKKGSFEKDVTVDKVTRTITKKKTFN